MAFLGDGANDALALHQGDVGISVESAADVAKDAAHIVLAGTASNFGNMLSAATACVVLRFLPMLPGQILVNNLLYDTGQLAIQGDRVDREQPLAPSYGDIAVILRCLFLFGPISSLFDFTTFC
ncbi:hypothetical protein AAFM46_06960 [Arthrobacter sp. TMP15]|uniref:hypothetical protein n=1 Tax=Arthrobacter sp. TMP15 TaxID=3140789 RepID=UPI0031BA9A30